MDKLGILELQKIPISSDKHLGIEIEFVSPFDNNKLANMLIEMDLQNNTELCDDGSIDEYLPSLNPHGKNIHVCETEEYEDDLDMICDACESDYHNEYDGYGHELKVITTEKDLKIIMAKVGSFLKRAKAEVNNSCGLHVHLDCRNRNVKTVANRFLKSQKQLRQMVASNRLSNTYCKPISQKELKDYWKKKFYDRYRDINVTALNKFKTIEIRLHQGSVSAKEITEWCKHLISIADNKKGNKRYVQTKIKNAKQLLNL